MTTPDPTETTLQQFASIDDRVDRSNTDDVWFDGWEAGSAAARSIPDCSTCNDHGRYVTTKESDGACPDCDLGEMIRIASRVRSLRVHGDWVLWGDRFDPTDATNSDGTPWSPDLLAWIMGLPS